MTLTLQQTSILAVARAQLGKPYLYGAKGPDRFDCSGLTAWAFSHGAGLDIGAGTEGQLLKGSLVGANVPFGSIVSRMQACDIIFPSATHCQLWTGSDVVEAANSSSPVHEVAEWAVPPYQPTVFQVRRYLPAIPTPPAPVPWPGRYLELKTPMMSGSDVSEWQAKIGGLTVDGWFGMLTANATKAFQAAHGLQVDGQVGPASWGAAFR